MQYSVYKRHEKRLDADYKIKVDSNWDDIFLSLVNYNSPSMGSIGVVFDHLVVDKTGVLSRAGQDGYWCLTDVGLNGNPEAVAVANQLANQLALSETHKLPIITRYDATDKKKKIYLQGKNGEDIEFEVYITSYTARDFLKKQLGDLIRSTKK